MRLEPVHDQPEGVSGTMKTLSSDDDLHFSALPNISVDHLSGFLEALAERGGEERLSALARHLLLTMDEMLPILEAVKRLGFAQVNEASIALTHAGNIFVEATICKRPLVFSEQALANVPQIAFIVRLLQQSTNFEQDTDTVVKELQKKFPQAEAKTGFTTMLEWGRYADVFEYDARTKRLHLSPVRA